MPRPRVPLPHTPLTSLLGSFAAPPAPAATLHTLAHAIDSVVLAMTPAEVAVLRLRFKDDPATLRYVDELLAKRDAP